MINREYLGKTWSALKVITEIFGSITSFLPKQLDTCLEVKTPSLLKKCNCEVNKWPVKKRAVCAQPCAATGPGAGEEPRSLFLCPSPPHRQK